MRLTSRVAGILATLACALALTGCAGLDSTPSSNEPDRVADGTGGNTGDLAVRGILVQPQADGAASGLVGSIVNQGTTADTLTSATIDGKAATVGGTAKIGPGATLVLGPVALSGGLAGEVDVAAAGAQATPGSVVEVTMGFRSAPSLTMQALVVSSPSASGSGASSTAATISPSPAPTG